MKKQFAGSSYTVVFFVSLFVIVLELFLTRILNLKAWNHVVYTVIPFAILGYGIGANAYLIFKQRIDLLSRTKVVGTGLAAISVLSLITVMGLIFLPIFVEYVLSVFSNIKAILMLLAAYTIFMLPFVVIGFLIVYLFSKDTQDSPRLYFFDLLGAGVGAVLFFPLINNFEVVHSVIMVSLAGVWLALCQFFPKEKIKAAWLTLLVLILSLSFLPEIKNYKIDKAKGWEWIPGYFTEGQYRQVASRWHSLGRTDIYRMIAEESRNTLYQSSPGTFLINAIPRPEFAYISTNFLAGTPVYNLSPREMDKSGSRIELFSVVMEVPYLFFDRPRVLVIGAGGGRDLFMAKTHSAAQITGAEINPGIVKEMSPGGSLYEYSGRVYTQENTKVHAMDGRTLVKKFKPRSVDLIVLNGVDTFSGLSSGAYAYAESYLYTKDALVDYLRILDDKGIVNFNRWLFRDMPRETLRLHAIALDALKTIGAQRPWEHVLIGDGGTGWSLTLIKKTPFTAEERQRVFDYFHKMGGQALYPNGDFAAIVGHPLNMFDYYAQDFQKGLVRAWERIYPFDISVITDDNPFFYKYYKLSSFNPFRTIALHHTGTIIFLTQMLVLLQAVVFIFLFIFFPLLVFKKNDLKKLSPQTIVPFLTFFSCLGLGYMFIEIPMMQRFVLLLGSPIHSITVVLSALLIATGIGSLALPHLRNAFGSGKNLLTVTTFFIFFYILILIMLGTRIFDHAIGLPFLLRALLVGAILFPLGFSLGVFFPSGLQLMGKANPDAIPWAWAVNGGFSVLGSILSIILAQFSGFNAILMIASVAYFVGLLAFFNLEKSLP